MTEITNVTLEPAARVIADSVSPLGYRVTTIEATMHRFVLAEFNTHRMFSRSSASSRAIPVGVQIDRIKEAPAWPVVWPCEQPGMQGGSELEGQALADAQDLVESILGHTLDEIELYIAKHDDSRHRLHKSVLNRYLEPFMWHTVVVTSTDWGNFDRQRVTRFSPNAQPEFRAMADLLYEARTASTPVPLEMGQWHLPYIDNEDWDWAETDDADRAAPGLSPLQIVQRLSVARVARISYLRAGAPREWESDLDRYIKLTSADPIHVAPLEMACTPAGLGDIGAGEVPGNFSGWHQLRHLVKPAHLDQDDLYEVHP